MKRFLFSLVGLFFAYLCFIHVWASFQPPYAWDVFDKLTSCILETVRYYTGQLREERGEPFYDAPRFSSLITVDGHVYVRVNMDRLFAVLGWSRYPEDWKSDMRRRIGDFARLSLKHEKERKERKGYTRLSRLWLSVPISEIEDIDSFKPYDQLDNRLYLLVEFE